MTRSLHWQDERGESPVTSIVGLVIFLLFLLFSVQMILHLSVLTRASTLSFDGATRVAREGEEACSSVLTDLTRRTQGWNGTPSCTVVDGVVTVGLMGDSPALVVDLFGITLQQNTVSREARVRLEEVQP